MEWQKTAFVHSNESLLQHTRKFTILNLKIQVIFPTLHWDEISNWYVDAALWLAGTLESDILLDESGIQLASVWNAFWGGLIKKVEPYPFFVMDWVSLYHLDAN